jgi:hypothetical protein
MKYGDVPSLEWLSVVLEKTIDVSEELLPTLTCCY